MKKITALFFVLVFGVGVISAQNKKLIDKVIAQVGSELILLSDVETEYNYLKSMNQVSGDETKCMILEQIMAQKLLIDQAKLDSIEVSDDQVDGQLTLRMDAILRQMGGDEELFKQYYGKSVAEMKEIYREDIKNKLMAESMQQSLLDNITVTPSEVVEFFKSIPKDSLPYFNSEVELAQIIIAPQINSKEKQRAYETAKDIKARLDKGEDFGVLAKKYSEDPGSANNNGDLGWVKRGTFVPKFEAAAYGLKKGEISDIIETEFGYHIIQLIERRGNSIHAKHILIKPDITLDDLNKAKAKLDSIRTLIVKDSMKFEVAVKRFSDKKSRSYNNNGRMTNPATQTTFYEMKDLPPDIYFAIEGLKPGDITSVMETTNEAGETRFQIIKVLTKTEPHRASLKEDYSRIQNFAKASKKNEYINNWIAKKIKTTYIKIDDEYRKCPNLMKWYEDNK